jgi:hypothetical protein
LLAISVADVERLSAILVTKALCLYQHSEKDCCGREPAERQ